MNHKHTNWLFDTIMPQVNPNTFRIICVVARKTWGWNKNADTISVSQFVKLSGIKTRTTVIKSINSAIDSGFISRKKVGQTNIYRMQFYEEPVQKLDQLTSTETRPVSHKTSTETVPTSLETVPELVQKLDPQIEKELIRTFSLAEIFTNLTGFFMPTDHELRMTQEQWVKPLKAIDGQGKAKERIEYAIQEMRTGGYTIKSPKSILTFALNWNGSKNKQVKVGEGGGVYV